MPGFSFASGRANYTISTAASGTLPALIAGQSIADQAGLSFAIYNTSVSAITLTATAFTNSASWTFATGTSITLQPDETVVVETEIAGNTYSVLSASGGPAGSVTILTDTTSASPVFPTFVHSTSGTLVNLYNDGANLEYTPSAGLLASKAFSALGGIFFNPRVLTANATVPGGNNGLSVGPVTIPPGIVMLVSQNGLLKFL